MKTRCLTLPALTLGMLLPTASELSAQTATAVSRVAAPLGLLRLQDTPKSGEAIKLVANKFAVDTLPVNGLAGVIKAQKDNVDTLLLDAGKEWSRPLRGSGREVTFVSFQVYGSQTTIIEIGGARLGLTGSPMQNGLQLMYDDSATGSLQWKSFNVHVPTAKYGGKNLAALHPLTVALDPTAGVWHLYSGSRLLADNLPLIASRRDNRQFTVKAGTEGAWVIGLVLADENPLYEDTNGNGVDDVFERQKLGALLPANATLPARQQLAKDWKAAQRTKPPTALFVNRPMPDRAVGGK